MAGRTVEIATAPSPRTELVSRSLARLDAGHGDPDNFDLDDFVHRVLAEDLGKGGDVTSAATIAADARFTAEMNARQPIVVAGIDVAVAFFRALDADVEIERLSRMATKWEQGRC